MIGTPAGVSGTSTSAMAPPSSAAASARRSCTCATSRARNSAGNAASRPRSSGLPRKPPPATPIAVPDDPRRVEQKPGPDQLARVEAAAALVRDHPRLVDGDLADQAAAATTALVSHGATEAPIGA